LKTIIRTLTDVTICRRIVLLPCLSFIK